LRQLLVAQILHPDDSLGDAPHRDVRLQERVDEAVPDGFRRAVLLQHGPSIVSGQLVELPRERRGAGRLVQDPAECVTHAGCGEESELVLLCERAREQELRVDAALPPTVASR
jgi:hypothetical protein